jgi:hypothetical protein
MNWYFEFVAAVVTGTVISFLLEMFKRMIRADDLG